MRKLLTVSVGLALLANLAYGMGSKPQGGTGDRRLDSTLEQIAFAASDDPDAYIMQLSSRHDIPEQDLRRARNKYNLGAGDLFMAAALARETRRPVYSVAEDFKQHQGKGWGAIAKDMGIKPGSSAFHGLKQDAQRSLDQMKAKNKSKQKSEQKVKKEHGRG